jgi:hypothetical protein
MPFRDLQARLSQTTGDFSRSRFEAWSIRAQAMVFLLVGCYLLGLTYRFINGSLDPVLKAILVLLVLGSFALCYALLRHSSGGYSIRNGEICFERPRGKIRWTEQIADITDVDSSVDWFWEKWVVLRVSGRKRRLELLPSLLQALHQVGPPNKSFERTREG